MKYDAFFLDLYWAPSIQIVAFIKFDCAFTAEAVSGSPVDCKTQQTSL